MAVFAGPTISNSGLIIYLDAANPKSYPGSGNIWYDLSGKENHATLYNEPVFANGRALFNGTNEYAQIAYNATDFDFSLEQTIFIVMSPTENDGARRNPYDQSFGGSGTWTHESNGSISYFYGTNATGGNGTPYTSISSATVLLNETAFMASTRKSNLFRRWYKNGTITYDGSGSVYTTVVNSTNNIRIGTGYAGWYQGYIDLVLVYSRALSTEEIQKNVTALRGRYGI